MKISDLPMLLKSGEMTEEEICPVMYAMSLIGQKWKINILWHLADEGPLRYNEIRRGIPRITNVVLAKCMKELTEAGLVYRDQQNDIPPVVVYSLTERGQGLIPILYRIHEWGAEQMRLDVAEARKTGMIG